MVTKIKELVINWHITEKCNYSCKFCYAKYQYANNIESELNRSLDNSKKMLYEVYNFFTNEFDRPIRLNFAGGEPFLTGNILVCGQQKSKKN